MLGETLVVVRGAGDLASGVIHRLVRSGLPVIATDIGDPTVIRRTVAFAEAIPDGEAIVEGMIARRVDSPDQALQFCQEGIVPVIVDPEANITERLNPLALVDAILAKKNLGTRRGMAGVVIGLGPGFSAGDDVDVVVETNRGHDLGRLIFEGTAEPNTGIPGNVGGKTDERVIRSPSEGVLRCVRGIGDRVQVGDVVAKIDGIPVVTKIDGILRGLLRNGLAVTKGFKVGDVDPRCQKEHCFTISDKARAIGGGVLEAILMFLATKKGVAS